MYNPEFVTDDTKIKIQNALVGMKDNDEGAAILDSVLGTPGIVATDAATHLGTYGGLIGDIPGINAYYSDKYSIN